MPRLLLPEVPLHITQRGVNKGAVFRDDEDRRHHRRLMCGALERRRVDLHALVLMGNHVHLLVTASTGSQLSRAMRHLGQCYVQAINLKYHRCGSLWQGRFTSCLLQSDRYLLNVMRYIELNPVRAAIAQHLEGHRWASVHTHLARASDPLVPPHPLYLAHGNDPVERARHYRTWLDARIAPDELAELRNYARQERAPGDARFQRIVEVTLG